MGGGALLRGREQSWGCVERGPGREQISVLGYRQKCLEGPLHQRH